MIFDISRLDSDPLIRDMMVGAMRLYHKDFPSGLKHPPNVGHGECPQSPIARTHCFVQDLSELGLTVEAGRLLYKINPEFAGFIHGDTDQDYIDAIKGWIVFQQLKTEVENRAASDA